MSEQAIEHGMDVPAGTEMPEGFELGDGVRRDSRCVENWPEADSSDYNPACCRFPKSCSATSVPNRVYAAGILEPAKDFAEVVAEISADHPAVRIDEGTRQLTVRQLVQALLALPAEALDRPVQVEGCDCSGPAIGINYDGTDTVIERGQEVYDLDLDQMVLKPI